MIRFSSSVPLMVGITPFSTLRVAVEASRTGTASMALPVKAVSVLFILLSSSVMAFREVHIGPKSRFSMGDRAVRDDVVGFPSWLPAKGTERTDVLKASRLRNMELVFMVVNCVILTKSRKRNKRLRRSRNVSGW